MGCLVAAGDERWWLGAALLSFYACAWLFRQAPGQAAPAVWLSAAVAGAFSARFFVRRRRLFARVAHLFWWENTGFLTGWVAAVGGWMVAGQAWLLWLPLLGYAAMMPGQWDGAIDAQAAGP